MPLVEMDLQYQQLIPGPPLSLDHLWSKSTGSDQITLKSWGKTWVNNTEKNRTRYDFNSMSVADLIGAQAYRPVILAGSGPSLRKNIEMTIPKKVKCQFGSVAANQSTQEIEIDWHGRGDIPIVSCLHNFPYFEDLGIMKSSDYYITLDAGPITVTECSEGGRHQDNPDHYWEISKDRTLIAHHTTCPDLLAKWQGKVLFYSDQSQVPGSLDRWLDVTKVPPFQVGGCVLGAGLYFSEAILGASQVIFVGADFSFSYNRKFHAWDSQYDQKYSGLIPATDVFGNRVQTWPSYFNFNCWFQHTLLGGAGNNRHNWINASEGGIFGAWPEGNICQMQYMHLEDVLKMYSRHKTTRFWMDKHVLVW